MIILHLLRYLRKVCKAKLLKNEIGYYTQIENSNFLDHILQKHNNSDNRWNAGILLGNTLLDFKIGTGADVTVVPSHVFMK